MKRVKSKAVQYWQHPFFGIKHDLMEFSPTTKLMLTAVLSSFAAIFQSAGGYVLGIHLENGESNLYSCLTNEQDSLRLNLNFVYHKRAYIRSNKQCYSHCFR